MLNEQVAFAAFHNQESASICNSEKLPARGLIALARWVDIARPVADVVDEAVAFRARTKA
ncbi:hypothetical protein USDA257_c39300 [Sinorhizobium fredii USDA 257]|uniref:Uncharacterized protein n=1 Tax=Sinorhizobium fredii (strain USDA 257) TaxID=1185652 RepID=I3X9B8_SINF2|nr:hypothetical protein USDA257_c39300 [Sinorhizobium fredii USDA 257]